ncbi:hypothetical protein [Paraburkholderia hospita]|uniref:hypothetical protein n=1 Tax=Paraburkholderia hospita TaxID=169430 RepID=UPI0008A79DE6|nr:hypothetical protein [Paraburkholderia hospita]SEI14474.1 hypothetical protein SAMN05192544_102541 [Paraburkholderia hospita]
MAEVERKPLRINGTVNDATDRALYDALSAVSLYKRMARLRQLAALGLMMEQGALPVSAPRPLPVNPPQVQPEAPVPPPKAPEPPIVKPPQREPPARVVTTERRDTTETASNTKRTSPKVDLSLMDKINLNIMR